MDRDQRADRRDEGEGPHVPREAVHCPTPTAGDRSTVSIPAD
jgi:hypothetical protein